LWAGGGKSHQVAASLPSPLVLWLNAGIRTLARGRRGILIFAGALSGVIGDAVQSLANLALIVALSLGLQVLSRQNALLGGLLKTSSLSPSDGFSLLAVSVIPPGRPGSGEVGGKLSSRQGAMLNQRLSFPAGPLMI
jgi:hypothetical protein